MANTSYKTLFSKLNDTKSSQDTVLTQELVRQIEMRITHARLMQSRIRATVYMSCAFVAVILCIPIIQSIMSSMANSGFSTYFSLIISDSSYIMSSWKEFGMTLVESFPIWSGAAALAMVLAFTYSLSKSLFYIKTIKTETKHLHTYA